MLQCKKIVISKWLNTQWLRRHYTSDENYNCTRIYWINASVWMHMILHCHAKKKSFYSFIPFTTHSIPLSHFIIWRKKTRSKGHESQTFNFFITYHTISFIVFKKFLLPFSQLKNWSGCKCVCLIHDYQNRTEEGRIKVHSIKCIPIWCSK